MSGRSGNGWALWTALGLGYLFLYLPIVILIIFSFNDSKLVHRLGRLDGAMVCRAIPE